MAVSGRRHFSSEKRICRAHGDIPTAGFVWMCHGCADRGDPGRTAQANRTGDWGGTGGAAGRLFVGEARPRELSALPPRAATPNRNGHRKEKPSDFRDLSGAQSRNRTSDTRIFKPSNGAENQPVARRFPVKPPAGNQALRGRLSNRFSGDPGQRKTVEGAATHLDGEFEVSVLTGYQNPDSGAIVGGLHV